MGSEQAHDTADPLAEQPEAAVDPQAILDKWNARLANQAGHGSFLRHLDGDLMNTAKENLECVHPFDAFAAMHHGVGWVTDWGVGLTEAEREFVKDNLWNFCAAYQQEGYGDDGEDNDGLRLTAIEEEVLTLSEKGDAALAAGDTDAAIAFFEAAKNARSKALFGTKAEFLKGISGAETGGDAKSPARFGRRSLSKGSFTESNRQSIITSTPARRHQPEGAPTKREEVQARIAARNSAPGH